MRVDPSPEPIEAREGPCTPPRPDVAFRGKYRIAADLISGCRGTLLDLGARDRTLARFLEPARFEYRSADLSPGHDHCVNLERPLPFEDRAFDVVVALDCLEHVENIHLALGELTRIARRAVVVALPNMASFVHRTSFAVRGRLATDKYDLDPAPRADRHRWLTVLPQTDDFVVSRATTATHRVSRIVHETEGSRPLRLLAWALLRSKFPLHRILTARSVYLIEAQPDR